MLAPRPPSSPDGAPETAAGDLAVVLRRIQAGLDAAMDVLRGFEAGAVRSEDKAGGRGPVTEADRAVDRVLADILPRDGEGWLSEESVDDPRRLAARRVWAVDPLDGTQEFVEGLPEWCVSVGLVEDGRPVAGGIANPATGEVFLGALGRGITYNGRPAGLSPRQTLEGALVLASRSEVSRGDWDRYGAAPFTVRAMGSVAYKMALVAAGLADATWTLAPKHEWDVAAGVALVAAAGGRVGTLDGSPLRFNQRRPWLSGLFASPEPLADAFAREIASAGLVTPRPRA
ncbi:MAG TPA: 3'(2'),5'-bisphosphate nucleotidase CysQ [Vicinamibacteria bacterium]|nr:3'(2'),5'-bisphosphate nucleotidase CysQ [Vicinamibacteria bacterium]